MNETTTSEERLMAALAHGSAILSFFGPVIPAILWSYQRKKSEHVRFHALQAMGYQAIFFWLWILAMIGIVFLSFLVAIPATILLERTSANPVMVPFVFQLVFVFGILGVFGLYFLLGIIGAVMCFMGKEFRYPLLGKWLERYLSRGSEAGAEINDAQEDNWVAGLCHMTVILQLWGFVLPGIVWITQQERSLRLKIQSMQSIIYQAVAFIAYILWTMAFMFLFLGMFFLAILSGSINDGAELPPAIGFILITIFMIMFLFGMLMNLLAPLYLLVALIAAISNIRGKNFRYPILGKLVERWMSKEKSIIATT